MAKFVLLNARIFAGGANLTGNSNQIELSSEIQEKDVTNFDSGDWKESLGGLASTSLSGSGQWEAGDPGLVDNESWADLTTRSPHAWTVCPRSAAVGDLSWSTQALRSSYKVGDTVGEVAPWEASASGSAPLLRGTVAHPPGQAETADGAGQGLNLGEVSDSQRIWVALHVLSVSGSSPALTVEVESDVDDTWSAPTTQITFDTASEVGAQFNSAMGPVTDTWWRVTWTISGTDPSFLFLAALAIA